MSPFQEQESDFLSDSSSEFEGDCRPIKAIPLPKTPPPDPNIISEDCSKEEETRKLFGEWWVG